jgi:hypothetical protein
MLDKKVATGGKKMPASKTTPPRQVETSMSKKYKGTPKVSQTTIDNIKKMGMTASLKKAASSKNPEYLEGIKRMYGANRLATAQKSTASPASRMSPRAAERAPSTTNRPSPRAMERTPAKKSSGKGISIGDFGKAVVGAAGATAAIIPVGRAIKAGKLAGVMGSRAVQSATGKRAAKKTGEVTQEQYAAMRATKIAKQKKAAAYTASKTKPKGK